MKYRYLYYLTFTVFLITSCRQTDITVVRSEAITVSADSSSQQSTPTRTLPQKIRVGELERITGFDPLFVRHNSNHRVLQLIYEGLVGYDADGNIIAVLASEWEISEDSLLYTFTLKDNIRFQDSPAFIDGKGRAITARDVYENFRRMTDPSVPQTAATLFSDVIQGFDAFNRERREVYISADRSLTTIQGIQVLDNKTIAFVLTKRAKNFLELLAGPYALIYPPELASRLMDQPIGSGPYRLSQVLADTMVTLIKAPFYWNSTYSNTIQSVDFRKFRSDSDILRAVINRQIDIIPELNPNSRIQLTTDKFTLKEEFGSDFDLIITEGYDFTSLVFNPFNGYGLTENDKGLILNHVNPDSLNELIQQSGITFEAWDYTNNLISIDTTSRMTLAFSGENTSNYLARNLYFLTNNRLPLTLVRSNVLSREITWAVLYESGLNNGNNVPSRSFIRIARFNNPRYAVINSLVENLSLNENPWWFKLDEVSIRLTATPQ